MREIVDRIASAVGKMDATALAVTTSGARYFLRQMVEPANLNLHFVSHSEVPAGTKVMSLGVIR
jgi:flagellar biosynthesis component FlhA